MRSAATPILLSLLFTGCVTRAPDADDGSDTSAASATDSNDPTAETGILGETSDSQPSTGEDSDPSETGAIDPPPACAGPGDPTVDAAFALDLSAWQLTEDTYAIDVQCFVDAVTTDAGVVSTALLCDVDDAPLPAVLQLAEAPDGGVAWAPGLPVRLVAQSEGLSDIDLPPTRVVQLRVAEDDALLAVGIEHTDLASPWYAPILIDTTAVCGPEEGSGDIHPLMLDFSLMGAPENLVTLFGGHRGALSIIEDESFAIDVQTADTNNCCHFQRWYQLLIRRVHTG